MRCFSSIYQNNDGNMWIDIEEDLEYSHPIVR